MMKENPWKVKSINVFSYLNCPECDFDTQDEAFLADHAVEEHPSCFVFCVKSIQSFAHLNCPECDFNTKEEIIFERHAIDNHPLSYVFFGKIKSANFTSKLFPKETEGELTSSVPMKDSLVQSINFYGS